MANTNGRITVTNVDKDEKYDINGVCQTLGDAISKFTNGAEHRGEVRLNGRAETNFDTPLRDGDVVLLMTAAVAGGGVKGAN